ncbi:MAG: FG-GAP-like repeat-containing protein, partial [Nitrospinota bacterium]
MKKKHPVKKRSQGLLPSILILTLLCSGCGVGGNEESSENVELPKNGATLFSEGAIKYTGTTAPARITRANAKEIMLSGYYGLDSVTPVLNKADQKKPLLSPDKNRKGAGTTPFFLRKILPSDSLLKFSPFENESANIQGECGGNLTLEIDSREPAGNFSGKITFVDYCMFDTTVSGEARIEAALSEDGTTLKRFKYELGLITAYWEDKSTLFTGTVVWKSRSDQSPFYRWKFNITLRDDTSKNTFRFEDYTITVKVNEFFVENNLEGKFYHPEHGLVTVRTHSPLRLYFNAIYPFKGGLSYEGQDNTRGELFFMSPTEIKLRADTDGNGLIDWEETGQRNTPPEADAGPTQTVFQGDIITLDGTASFDPESAPLEFNWTFESCPQECPELQNHTSRVATFIPDHRGTYRVLLVVTDGEDQSSDAVAIIVKGLESSSLLSLEWAHGILGTRIGLSGLSLVDINGDQTKEIISAGGDEFGGNVFWYILSPEANGTFSQVWRSARYPAVIKKIEAVDVNRDGEVEILVGLENGVIHFYKGKTRKNIGRIQISDHLTDFTIADTNGDEKVELVATDGTGIFVYNPENLSLLRSATSYGGDKIRVGNVDADPWLEIVTTARGHKHDQRPTGYVLSASTFRVEWKYINGFGRLLELGDIDNDGRDEIIGASGGNRVTIFEGETQSADWEIHADLDIDALHISDVNGDGVPEILFDDWRRIFCIDG